MIYRVVNECPVSTGRLVRGQAKWQPVLPVKPNAKSPPFDCPRLATDGRLAECVKEELQGRCLLSLARDLGRALQALQGQDLDRYILGAYTESGFE
jgi:hypothetical protein